MRKPLKVFRTMVYATRITEGVVMLSAVEPDTLRKFAAAHAAYRALAAAPPPNPSAGSDGNRYALDETGHVLAVMPAGSTALEPAVQDLFRRMVVFFGAVSQALASEHRSVFDYEALCSIIERSGLFVPLQLRALEKVVSSRDTALNLALIGSVFGDLTQSPDALRVARGTLNGVGDLLRWSTSQGESARNVGHLLLTCESLHGMPIASVRLYALNAGENEELVKGDCRQKQHSNLRVRYRENVYLFSDPAAVDSVVDSLAPSPALEQLVERLRAAIPAIA